MHNSILYTHTIFFYFTPLEVPNTKCLVGITRHVYENWYRETSQPEIYFFK